MLADHAQALDLALQWADEKHLPSVHLLQELAGAVMRANYRAANQ